MKNRKGNRLHLCYDFYQKKQEKKIYNPKTTIFQVYLSQLIILRRGLV